MQQVFAYSQGTCCSQPYIRCLDFLICKMGTVKFWLVGSYFVSQLQDNRGDKGVPGTHEYLTMWAVSSGVCELPCLPEPLRVCTWIRSKGKAPCTCPSFSSMLLRIWDRQTFSSESPAWWMSCSCLMVKESCNRIKLTGAGLQRLDSFSFWQSCWEQSVSRSLPEVSW